MLPTELTSSLGIDIILIFSRNIKVDRIYWWKVSNTYPMSWSKDRLPKEGFRSVNKEKWSHPRWYNTLNYLCSYNIIIILISLEYLNGITF